MRSKIDKGKLGEDMAVDYLAKKGYQIIHRNWRQSRSEIDIIAQLEKKCVFVEVKYREGDRYGHPEQAVNEQKIEMMRSAAEYFLDEHPEYATLQFDIVAITVDKKNRNAEIFHFEDVYF